MMPLPGQSIYGGFPYPFSAWRIYRAAMHESMKSKIWDSSVRYRDSVKVARAQIDAKVRARRRRMKISRFLRWLNRPIYIRPSSAGD